MAKFTVHDKYNKNVDGYEVDTNRQFEGYEEGDILCRTTPFSGIPITLNLAIRKNGSIIFRSWEWNGRGNSYLHIKGNKEDYIDVTQEQIYTVNGLFSGRITWDGLKLAVGATLQEVCPIDIKREEELIGKKIYLE